MGVSAMLLAVSRHLELFSHPDSTQVDSGWNSETAVNLQLAVMRRHVLPYNSEAGARLRWDPRHLPDEMSRAGSRKDVMKVSISCYSRVYYL